MNCAARLWLLQTPNAPKSLEFLIKMYLGRTEFSINA